MKPKVAYFTNVAPHYREKLWLAFIENLKVEFHFFFGKHPNPSIKSIDFEEPRWQEYQKQIHDIENIKFKGRLIYQAGVIKQILFNNWDVIILLGDANIISNWIAAKLARFRGIPVIFWGHGIYGNEMYLKKKIRKIFLSLADINLVYGHWAKNQMIKENFNPEHIKVIYNSLDYQQSKALREIVIIPRFYKPYFKNIQKTFIFIGRLTKQKKLHLLIYSLSELAEKDQHFNLMIIGDGQEKENLRTLAKKLHVNIYFMGACYDEKKIAECMANADFCVSPGNVGLTAIHAMSYGTPVCTNNDFSNQGPEFEAIQSWETGCFFDWNQQNLTETIINWFEKAPKRELVREQCYRIVDENYNPNTQTEILKKAIKELTIH
jgi:glycosyltransferase involved in cell wall biosynthesis